MRVNERSVHEKLLMSTSHLNGWFIYPCLWFQSQTLSDEQLRESTKGKWKFGFVWWKRDALPVPFANLARDSNTSRRKFECEVKLRWKVIKDWEIINLKFWSITQLLLMSFDSEACSMIYQLTNFLIDFLQNLKIQNVNRKTMVFLLSEWVFS